MKRFVLGAASVMALGTAAPGFAQTSSSYIDQIDTGNTATVGQTAAGSVDNFSKISQEGTGNTAKVVQSGVIGRGGSGSGGASDGSEEWWDNKSWILQYGTGHTAEVIQIADGGLNSSNIKQNGMDNYATVKQHGASDSWSDITQSSANNSATVDQSGVVGVGNYSNVTQSGSNNTATVTQD
jgi:hypothetical protein